MTPETFTFIQQFGLPLVGLVAVAYVLYRTLMGTIADLRAQRDAAIARTDTLIGEMANRTVAMTDLTAVVREVIAARREVK